MPLVVPGLQSKGNSGENDWMSKLMGKKLGDQHDETVRCTISSTDPSTTFLRIKIPPPSLLASNYSTLLSLTFKRENNTNSTQTFAKKDLPEEHRILKPDSTYTTDHKPERLNIHVDDDGTVKKVVHG